MRKADFKIGKEFFTASGTGLCTDIGTRTIVAIKKDKDDTSTLTKKFFPMFTPQQVACS